MSKSPEELLFSPLLAGESNLIRPNLDYYELEIARETLQDRVKQAKSLFQKAASDHNRTNLDELNEQFERRALSCIRKSCSVAFLDLYGRELAQQKTSKGALEYIVEIFGEESEEDRATKAQEDLEKLTRRTDSNERFSAFLKRVQSLARSISTKKDAQEHLTELYFKRQIDPSNTAFLRDNCMLKSSAFEIAKFLDDRSRFLTANVSQIGQSKIDDFMDNTSDLLARQLDLIREENSKRQTESDKKAADFAEAIKALTATVAQLKVEKSRDEPKQNSQNAQNLPNFQPNYQQFQPRFQQFPPQFSSQQPFFQRYQPRQTRPLFCTTCNKPGHGKSTCRLTLCYECKNLGHIARNCPNKQPVSQGQPNAQNQPGPHNQPFAQNQQIFQNQQTPN
jgi:hypothetical protein